MDVNKLMCGVQKYCGVAVVLALLGGCNNEHYPKQIDFQVLYKGEPVNCDSELALTNGSWQLSALLFYVAELNYQNKTGRFDYQKEEPSQVALIGTRCEDEGLWSVPVEWKAADQKASKNANSLRFTLGVPFDLNHRNPLLAKAPLDDSDMFWTWQLGYKFMRFDVSQTDKSQHWALHFGSLGCESASAMRAPQQACLHPNQVPVVIDNFDPARPIYLHLDKIFSDDVVGQKNCMGDPEALSCQSVFAALSKTEADFAVFNQAN